MTKIAFIGAGNMNGAIIKGLVGQGIPAKNIIVSNPSAPKREAMADKFGILQTPSNDEAVAFADVVILGVKPHLISEVCQAIANHADISTKCFISVAAGTTIKQMQSALEQPCSVIRTMPNTPSELGLGVTGLYACERSTDEEKTLATKLMSAVGETVWCNSELQIDQITTISGSGPAYFFLFMEAMVENAKAYGFDEQTCRRIVQQTAAGAAEMVKENPELEIGTLRENVTSKGGVTQAALNSFVDDGLPQLVTNAVKAALHRTQEMAQNK